MTTSQILTAAADLIEEKGWTQGQDHDSLGRYCAWGAIFAIAKNDIRARMDAGCALYSKAVAESDYGTLALWNDARERTKDEVVAALRKTALAVSEKVT